MVQGIQQILGRIADIESRFTRPQAATAAAGRPQGAAAADFRQVLQGALEGSGAAAAAPPAETVRHLVSASAQRQGVSPQLALAVARAESNFDAQAVSAAGAQGVMQLMPDTARSLGVRNPQDPRENIDGGVAYLRQMLQRFDGDVSKAAAAYNAGPGAVEQYGGVPPYGETQQYVQKVLQFMAQE